MAAVHACAALVAFATVAGQPPLARELCYHVQPASAALALAGLTVCAAVAFGLWYPRRLIQRRLAQTLGGPMDAPTLAAGSLGDGLELRFAARLTAAIQAVLTAAWLLASGAAAGLESWRSFLVNRFYLPPGLFPVCVTAPLLATLALIGVCTTIALVAAHGWYRFATWPHTRIARLWRSLLASALIGALTPWLAGEMFELLLPAVGGTLAATVVALCVRAGSAAGPPIQPRPRKQDNAMRLSLLNVFLMGFVIAFSALWTLAAHDALTPPLAPVVCAVAIGTVCGAGLGRILLHVGLTAQAAPLLIIATIMLSNLSSNSPGQGLAVLGLVSAAAALCVILVARRISLLSGSVQYSLAWTGGALACGAGTAFLIGLLIGGNPGWGDIGLYWGSTAAAVAGISLLLTPQTRAWLRWSGTVLTAIAVAAPFMLARPAPRGAPTGTEHSAAGHNLPATLGREWLRTGALHWEVIGGEVAARTGSGSTLWDVDRAGPRADALFVPASQWQKPASSATSSEAESRLLRRAAQTLLPGGHLVLELKAGSTSDLPTRLSPSQILPDGSAYRLRLTSRAGTYDAIILGPDVNAWLAQRALPEGCTLNLTPLTSDVSSRTPRAPPPSSIRGVATTRSRPRLPRRFTRKNPAGEPPPYGAESRDAS